MNHLDIWTYGNKVLVLSDGEYMLKHPASKGDTDVCMYKEIKRQGAAGGQKSLDHFPWN